MIAVVREHLNALICVTCLKSLFEKCAQYVVWFLSVCVCSVCNSGRLVLIDLAGSERVKKSDVSGLRMKEAQHINKSLAALGKDTYTHAFTNTHSLSFSHIQTTQRK